MATESTVAYAEGKSPGKFIASENAQSDVDTGSLKTEESYFEWARQSGQPWPERPRVQDYTWTKVLKLQRHMVFPEVNIPIQDITYSQDKTLRFSERVSNLLSIRLVESIDEIKKLYTEGDIPLYKHKARSMYRKITKHRKPSLGPVRFPFDDKRPTRTANIQFPECIMEVEDFSWYLPGRQIQIATSTAERILENAILWIDEKHWVLDSFKHLSCAPQQKLVRD